MKSIDILFLSREDVIACAPSVKETREIIDGVFKAHAEKRVVMPTKMIMTAPAEFKGRWVAMPAFVETPGGAVGGIKWLSSYTDNIMKFNLPNIVALIALNDPATGFPLAVMDGTTITGIRTAAAVACGARYLAPKKVEKIAVIGTSVQGRTNLAGIVDVFPGRQVAAYDISAEVCTAFIADMTSELGIEIVNASSLPDAVRGSDIVITATRTKEPFFKGEWLEPGMLLVSIGSAPELMDDVPEHADKIVTDDWEGCKHMGSLMPFYENNQLTEVYADISQIAGGNKPGRETEDERIIYVPMGMGSEDIAVGWHVYTRALAMGRGSKFRLC